MENKSSSTKEHVLKEYPNVTYWLEGNAVQGWCNLILTSERLIFKTVLICRNGNWRKYSNYPGKTI